MKKKVFVLLAICFMFAFMQQYFKQNSELADFINSTLANVESLAQDETGPDSWLQPDDVRLIIKRKMAGFMLLQKQYVCFVLYPIPVLL